MIKQLHNLYN